MPEQGQRIRGLTNDGLMGLFQLQIFPLSQELLNPCHDIGHKLV